jgi:hypothetical protein
MGAFRTPARVVSLSLLPLDEPQVPRLRGDIREANISASLGMTTVKKG